MKLNSYSLGTKINLSVGLTVALTLVLGLFAVYSLVDNRTLVDHLINREARKMELSGAVAAAAARMESAQRGVLVATLTGNNANASSGSRQVAEAADRMDRAIAEITPLLWTDRGKQAHAKLRAGAADLKAVVAEFDRAVKDQRFDEAARLQGEKLQPAFARVTADAEALVNLQKELLATAQADADGRSKAVVWVAVVLCLLSGGIGAAGFLVLQGGMRQLRRLAGEIGEGSRQVASAAQQVSSSSQALAQGSSEQAASLEETSASTEEINSMTRKNAESARGTAAETEKADHLLKETDQKLGQMIQSMKDINASSEKISKIIRVIDEIAFQTNILALNAAVEAARAGEAGMGFAVVADEVRNLAQRCAQAAKDTSDLIEESIQRSGEGKTRLDEVAASVGRVVENASRIKQLSGEVHLGSQEQARGIEQIARAVTQMQQVTQSTAASAEEGASAGEEMSAQAVKLEEAVERLRELVGEEATAAAGAGASKRPAAPRPPQRLETAAARPRPGRDRFPMDDEFRDF
jgi:methyl-accepting chemotaxis protein/methyl-accepting chemotaxis protein-1 (serine sensor receptor)